MKFRLLVRLLQASPYGRSSRNAEFEANIHGIKPTRAGCEKTRKYARWRAWRLTRRNAHQCAEQTRDCIPSTNKLSHVLSVHCLPNFSLRCRRYELAVHAQV